MNNLNVTIILNIIFILFSQSIFSQTPVSGNQSGNWTLSHSPYQVTGDVTIPSGQTLSIEAGVQIVFQGYYRIYVDGKIEANGTENNLIVFTPADQNTGWGGIRLDGTPNISIFHYCKFEYGKTSATGSYPDMHGGAVVIKDANAQFYNCIFSHNDATGDDDGMGGAVYTLNSGDASLSLTKFIDCLFEYNHAYGEGGAIKFTNDGNSEITRCQFIGNTSNYGAGAIMFYTALNTRLTQCLFYQNSTENSGGGALKSLNPQTSLSIANCTFVYNTAYGAGEGGAADFDYADVSIVNSIFYGNNQTYGKDINVGQSTTVDINYSDVDMPDYATGNHNLNNINPLFVNPSQGDFHLQANSPCIDAGLDIGLPYNGNAPDMGCYEYNGAGIDDLSGIGISIYPNPVQNQLFIKQEKPKNIDIKLIDHTGRAVLSLQSGQQLIPVQLDNFASGIYQILITRPDRLYLQKIIIR